jgi:hypothetical protein
MAFTQTNRIWWDTSRPGASTLNLYDADVPTTPDTSDDSGIVGTNYGEQWVICERSGFPFPLSQTTIDPNTGKRVGRRFVDPPAPIVDQEPG